MQDHVKFYLTHPEMKQPKPSIVANSRMREMVRERAPFRNSNKTVFSHVYSSLNPEGSVVYVVYSYDYHFPMFVHDSQAGWFENTDKYSRTTSRHQTQCWVPGQDYKQMDTEELKTLILHQGYVGYCANRITH